MVIGRRARLRATEEPSTRLRAAAEPRARLHATVEPRARLRTTVEPRARLRAAAESSRATVDCAAVESSRTAAEPCARLPTTVESSRAATEPRARLRATAKRGSLAATEGASCGRGGLAWPFVRVDEQ